MKSPLHCAVLVVAMACAPFLSAQTNSGTVVFADAGFPTFDSAPVPQELLAKAFPGATFSSARELAGLLEDGHTQLLVLSYGSAFPEEQWAAIHNYLLRGGNLLTIGGRAFTRPVLQVDGSWSALPETYAYARRLLITDYQEAPGSSHSSAEVNPDSEAPPSLAGLKWQRAYSLVVRLSQEETSPRIGASGTWDAELKTLLWGVSGERRTAAPAVEVDHFQNDYAGGRWVMLNCQLEAAFLQDPRAAAALDDLAAQARRGAELLRVTPTYALYLPDEAWQLELEWNRFHQPPMASRMMVTIRRNGQQKAAHTFDLAVTSFPVHETVTIPASGQTGFHTAEIRMMCGETECGVYHTGFWVRDRSYLLSGPKVTVDRNYFAVDGKPIEVVGTTYLASDAQRLYFRYPNPWVWDRDMKEISASGINMLRTGIWTDWDVATGDTHAATERTLRTLEAYLMSARAHGLPVQFTLFAFMPEVFGGSNPYLDPEALRREHEFVASLARPFADVPFLMWDLINEPSFDNPRRFFSTHPNGDAQEAGAWTDWLLRRYGSRDAVARAWNTILPEGPLPVPADTDETAQSANDGGRPAAIYDFNLFAQQSFADWAQGMRATIRATGSRQLITVGQDEGGALISPSPAFFRLAVDFTTIHSWWFNDDLLWDSLMARQKDTPMLVQETGVMTETNLDGRPRRTAEQDAALIERKIGLAMSTGAGAIEWQWNVNAVMRSQQEVAIGAVRPDGTDKAEARVVRAYAAFAKKIESHLSDPEPEPVAILTSQSEQFSVLQPVATAAQQRAVHALSEECHIASRIVTENHVDDIAGSQLTILPSPQMLQDSTWQALLAWVHAGGSLLITGPVERDEHWQLKNRLQQLGVTGSSLTSLVYRNEHIQLGSDSVEASFPYAAQRAVEALHFEGGQSYLEVKYGSGTVFLVDVPVELSESPDATAAVYAHVIARLNITPAFEAPSLPSSILVRARVFRDSVLYLLASESGEDTTVDLRDKASGGRIHVALPAGRTALILLNRVNGSVEADYQPPEYDVE